jgi:hypothetical protein
MNTDGLRMSAEQLAHEGLWEDNVQRSHQEPSPAAGA